MLWIAPDLTPASPPPKIRPDRVAIYVRDLTPPPSFGSGTAVYMRCNTVEQAVSERDARSQAAWCQECVRREGWSVRDDLTFVDNHHAPDDPGRRPALQALHRRIARGDVDAVMVDRVKHLALHPDGLMALLAEWRGRCALLIAGEPSDAPGERLAAVTCRRPWTYADCTADRERIDMSGPA